MTESTIAEELSAEIQLSMENLSERLASEEDTLRSIAATLREQDFAMSIDERGTSTTICAIVADSASRPAFSGMLYGAAALRLRMEVDGTSIIDVEKEARTELDVVDFVDSWRRVRWAERRLMYDLAAEVIGSDIDSIIFDRPLTITRQEMLTRTDSPAESDWNQLLEELDAFWDAQREAIQPWSDMGPVVAGISRSRSDLVFSALANAATDAFAESVTAELQSMVTEWHDAIDKIGPHRLLTDALNPGERTPMYPYQSTRLDRRWLPEQLNTFGIQAVSCMLSPGGQLLHLELPGSSDAWASDRIDHFMAELRMATWPKGKDVPVPLWNARELCEFPKSVLESYYKKLQQQQSETET